MTGHRYAAFLRGISPMNAKMADLRACCEDAGLRDVATVASSGNIVFTAPRSTDSALATKIERALMKNLGRSFLTVVRPANALRAMLDADPYARFCLAAGAKRIVTFLRAPPDPPPKLPIEREDARILSMAKGGLEVFGAYVPHPGNPAFMTLLEKTLGKEITTRTWDAVEKITRAATG